MAALEVGDGLVVLPFFAPGDAAKGEVDLAVGIESDGFGVVGDRLGEFLPGDPGHAAVYVGRREFRVESNRLVVIGEGLIELAGLEGRGPRQRCKTGSSGLARIKPVTCSTA